MTGPVILGAGPAGCSAAIVLARSGADPLLIDRDTEPGDALCGGFMSWRTAQALAGLGINLPSLGAHRVTALRLFAGGRTSDAALPHPAYGLSRNAFDSALRRAAVESGARFEVDRARSVLPGRIVGDRQEWVGEGVFLATGKHDVRGQSRPRAAKDPALGIRVRLPPSTRLDMLVGDRIELHLFEGGYAGIVLQEDRSANVCLAVRKSMLTGVGGDPPTLLRELAQSHAEFGARMADFSEDRPVDTIGAVPYGYIAQPTGDGLFRLGDQAAVIPSLAGEGMGIAIASGVAAANAWLKGGAGAACGFQKDFAQRAARPVRTADLVWRLAERKAGAMALAALAGYVPGAATIAIRASRIAA